jgi:predicted acylesterase/phospholipase RssA
MSGMKSSAAVLERLQCAHKVGLLFAGGGARCAFQLGVVETLFAYGIEPAVCLGVSGGVWNAAAVAAGNARKLRAYWRFFCRMPLFDLSNLVREHSPFSWRRLHERAFRRYVSEERLRAESKVELLVALTRFRDRASVVMNVREADDPFQLLLATNYLPPFYTHPPVIGGERYGDAAFSDNLPYEALFERGCDAVVLITQKGECEGGLFRNVDEDDHEIPGKYRDRVVVIRPRHRIDLRFSERRWKYLGPAADFGAQRAREVLLGQTFADEGACGHGHGALWYAIRLRQMALALV